MRIIRVRRGFTTNSSGANEYLPSAAQGPTPEYLPLPTSRNGVCVVYGSHPNSSPTHAQRTHTSAGPVPGRSATQGNALTIGVVIGAVALLFAAERVVRFVIRKMRRRPHE